jgi:hypothetical protein
MHVVETTGPPTIERSPGGLTVTFADNGDTVRLHVPAVEEPDRS